jgi:ADP-heptose:LPS heptosyltransferase
MRKLILQCRLSPGDIVMLTAAVEALHVQYPGQYLTDVRTPCPDLWKHNPYLTPLREDDPEVEQIECHYPLIHKSNQLPYHFIHGYVQFLAAELKIPIQPAAFRGSIHLHPEEKSAEPKVDGPYWLIVAGGKYDFTIKWWDRRRWQKVVDHCRGRIQFVQVGESGHYHPPLRDVIDLRGATSLRDLVLLVHHAAGVVCPVTLLMHLAAAVPCANGVSLRPCVVVAGGREPPHWEAYPGHQFLHTMGALPCCAQGGCWRARTVPLHDDPAQDAPSRLCLRPMSSGLPECMDMIEPRHVTDAIEWYCRDQRSASPPFPPSTQTQPAYQPTTI